MQPFDQCVFHKVFQSFRMAIQPSKLIIAFFAIILIWLVGWTMDFATRSVITAGPEAPAASITELQIYLEAPDAVPAFLKLNAQTTGRTGVFHVLWHFAAAKFHAVLIALPELNVQAAQANVDQYLRAVAWAFQYHTLYIIIFVLLKLAVIAVAGGAICRISALQFARGEKPGLIEAVGFSLKRFRHFYFAPLFPVVIIIAFAILFFLVPGLLANIPKGGVLILAVCVPFLLLVGAVIAIIIIGLAAGFGLMFPAIAYGGLELFDSISHAFSYIYSRPWRMTCYNFLAAIYGAACYIFVRFFAFLILLSTHTLLAFFIWTKTADGINKLNAVWPKPTLMDLANSASLTAPSGWTQVVAAFIISLAVLVIIGLLVSFVISFYFSANTIIYALMRNKVDKTPFDDVYTGFDNPTQSNHTEF